MDLLQSFDKWLSKMSALITIGQFLFGQGELPW